MEVKAFEMRTQMPSLHSSAKAIPSIHTTIVYASMVWKFVWTPKWEIRNIERIFLLLR